VEQKVQFMAKMEEDMKKHMSLVIKSEIGPIKTQIGQILTEIKEVSDVLDNGLTDQIRANTAYREKYAVREKDRHEFNKKIKIYVATTLTGGFIATLFYAIWWFIKNHEKILK
jgi:hypothetical protein